MTTLVMLIEWAAVAIAITAALTAVIWLGVQLAEYYGKRGDA